MAAYVESAPWTTPRPATRSPSPPTRSPSDRVVGAHPLLRARAVGLGAVGRAPRPAPPPGAGTGPASATPGSDPAAQRTPVNTEAKLLMLTHAFEVWGVRAVRLQTDSRNERSRAAIARLGLQPRRRPPRRPAGTGRVGAALRGVLDDGRRVARRPSPPRGAPRPLTGRIDGARHGGPFLYARPMADFLLARRPARPRSGPTVGPVRRTA